MEITIELPDHLAKQVKNTLSKETVDALVSGFFDGYLAYQKNSKNSSDLVKVSIGDTDEHQRQDLVSDPLIDDLSSLTKKYSAIFQSKNAPITDEDIEQARLEYLLSKGDSPDQLTREDILQNLPPITKKYAGIVKNVSDEDIEQARFDYVTKDQSNG